MEKVSGASQGVGKTLILSCLITLVVIGLVIGHDAPALAGASGPPDATSPQVSTHDYIGLAEANNISVQSLSPGTAPITITLALADGTPVRSDVDRLPAESFGFYPEPPAFQGQAAVEVDPNTTLPAAQRLPVFAVNLELSGSGNDGYLGINQSGDQQTADNLHRGEPQPYVLRLPWVAKDFEGWTTEFTIQNLASNSATFIGGFYSPDGVLMEGLGGVLPVGGSLSFDLAAISNLPPSFVGSVSIWSDQSLSVAASVRTSSPSGLRSAYRAGDPAMVSNVLVAPALFNDSDRQTSELCVQNAHDQPQTVSVEYADGVVQSKDLALFGIGCISQASEGHVAGWVGGAVISAPGPLLAVVNVTATHDNTAVGRWSYAVPSRAQAEQASGTLALPLLLHNYQQWTTTVLVYNFGGSPAVITPRYTSPTGSAYCADPTTIPAGGTVSIEQSDLPRFMIMAAGYFTSTQPVAAVVRATSSKNLGDTDRHFSYEAGYPEAALAPRSPCGPTVAHEVNLPLIVKPTP